MPEAPTVAPVEAAKPVAPIEAPTVTVPTAEAQTAAAATKAIDASGDVQVGLDTLAQAATEGEQRDLDADLTGTPSLREQQGQFNPDDVDAAAATELDMNTGPKTTEIHDREDTSTLTAPEPVIDNAAFEDTTNPTSQPATEGDITQPQPEANQTDKTNETTKPLEGQQPEPTGEEDRQAEKETPEAQAKRRLEQGLEIAAKVIDLPGLDKGVPKALIEAIKDNPELIDALHGPLSQAESADQLILNLTKELRNQSAPEGEAAASAAPETPNAPTETPGPQNPGAEGAPSNTPSSSGENSTNNSEAAKKEEEKAAVEKLSKTKKLLIVALLILLGVSLSSVAAIPELK